MRGCMTRPITPSTTSRSASPTSAAPAPSTRRRSAGSSTTTARSTPASARPTARARSAASASGRPSGAGGVLVLLYSLDLDATRRGGHGSRRHDHRGALRVPRRAPVPLRRPDGNVLGVYQPARLDVSRRPDLRGRGGDERAAAGPAQRRDRGSSGLGVVRRERTAVVLERELGDLEGLDAARGQVGAARRAPRAVRRTTGRCRRFISRSATSGRQRATSSRAIVVGRLQQGRPQRRGRPRPRRAAGAARPACGRHVTAAPTRSGTSPVTTNAAASRTSTASPASSAALLNAPGPPRPTRSPSAGSAAPMASRPA